MQRLEMNLELKYTQTKKGGRGHPELVPPPTAHSRFQWFDNNYGTLTTIIQELFAISNKNNKLANKYINADKKDERPKSWPRTFLPVM